MAAPCLRRGVRVVNSLCIQCRLLSRSVHHTGGSLASQFQAASQSQHPEQRQPPAQTRLLCRTTEPDPAKHNSHHHGLFYTVAEGEDKRWLSRGNQPELYAMAKAFGELSLMVRQPGLELVQYMQNASYKLPAIRYILYGRYGSGKSCTVSYAMHYCGRQGWLLMHIPWAAHLNRYYREVQQSSFKAGRFDLPLEAADWLTYFRNMNLPLLKELNLKTKHSYVWNRRESTEEGTPLLEAIEFGLSRPKYACDVIGLIIKEVKLQAAEGRFQTLVAIDGVNAFWTETTIRREEDRTKKVHSSELSIVHNFKKLLSNDWSGGAVLCTVDDSAGDLSKKESYMPRYLLGKEAFEFFDPHIPIHVPHYDDKEIHSCLDYYTEQRWIQNPKGHTEAGRQEIIFLSGHNPREVYNVTQMW